MNKENIVVISASLFLTCLFSTLFALAGSTIVGTFWAWFWLSILFLVIGFAIVNSILIQRDSFVAQELELRKLDAFSKFTIKIKCAYCEQVNTTPIHLHEKNTFKCESCNQINGISMQFTATTITTPVESVKIPIDNSTNAEFKVVTM